jgi:hypothetical protein
LYQRAARREEINRSLDHDGIVNVRQRGPRGR